MGSSRLIGSGTTRREFLKRVGQGFVLTSMGGCTHALFADTLPFSGEVVGEDVAACHALRDRPLDFGDVEPDPHLYDVIIIGAGISGLAAAWKLLRSGVTNLLVLEKGDRVGGTSIADETGDIVYPWGAHYIESPQPHRRYLLEICEDLRIILDYIGDQPMVDPNFIVPEPEVSLLAGGKWRPAHFPIEIATSQEVMEFERFRQHLYRWALWRDREGRPAFGCPNQYTSPDEEVRALDRLTMREYLDSLGMRSRPLLWYVDNRMQDEYGCTIDNVSAWAGLHFWAQSKSSFMDFEPPGSPAPVLLSWPEGNAFLAKGLARGLKPTQLRLGTLVARVQDVRDRVHVTYLSGEERQPTKVQARWIIHAVPKNSVNYLIPELKREGRTEFEACEYVPWVTAAVHLESYARHEKYPPAWEVLNYGDWGLGYIDNLHMLSLADRWDMPTVLTFYAALSNDPTAERYMLFREGWEYWARRVLGSLERMHPGIARRITRLDIFKWGHAMVAMRPGFLWGEARQRMLAPFGHIHFAGVDVAGTPVFEQATYRGIEVAEATLHLMGIAYRSSLGPSTS